MEQPALGKRILALRIERGLTQEELVEKCNISVRTIQRIENGEVSPRSYTIKSILAALDAELDKAPHPKSNFFDTVILSSQRFMLINIDVEESSGFLIRQLNIAGVFGILYFGIGFFESAAEYFLFAENKLIFSNGVYVAIKIGSLLSFIIFQRGFILIGNLFRNYLLKVISVLMIVSMTLLNVYDIIALFNDAVGRQFIAAASALTFGFMGIVYGFSLVRLEGSIGRISKYAGILEIIGSCFLLTILLAFVGLIIYIPAELLEVLILFKVIDIVRQKQKENNLQ
jgi:transcriptional regulator with XRE-family HTH domain